MKELAVQRRRCGQLFEFLMLTAMAESTRLNSGCATSARCRAPATARDRVGRGDLAKSARPQLGSKGPDVIGGRPSMAGDQGAPEDCDATQSGSALVACRGLFHCFAILA